MKLNWDQKILEDYIKNQVEENQSLEYKSAAKLSRSRENIDDITKTISSFANANGGIVIFGIAEFKERDKKHLPEKLDSINCTQFSKEWLDQIISNIQPKIPQLKIISVKIDESTSEVVYVVEVEKSNTAHQATDLKYYKRLNTTTIALQDFEIDDLKNRSKTPNIILEFKLKKIITKVTTRKNDNRKYLEKSILSLIPSTYTVDSVKTEYELLVRARNIGSIVAHYVVAFVTLPYKFYQEKAVSKRSEVNEFVDEIIELEGKNTIREVVGSQFSGGRVAFPQYGPSRYEPILPNLSMKILKINLKNIDDNNFDINWIVYSDNSKPNEGSIKLIDIELEEINEEDFKDETRLY